MAALLEVLLLADVSLPLTSPSLLGRLRRSPTDEQAWGDFVERYAPSIYGWCREWGLQDADARDVSQMVLSKLALRMRTFQYNPQQSFRRWLWTVTRHALMDFHRDRASSCQGSGSDLVQDQLNNAAAHEDLLTRLGNAFDLELLEEAYIRVRVRVEPRTWEAFRLTALEGLSGAEAATRLGMSVAAIFMARSNVQKMLRLEIQHLEEKTCPSNRPGEIP